MGLVLHPSCKVMMWMFDVFQLVSTISTKGLQLYATQMFNPLKAAKSLPSIDKFSSTPNGL